MNYTEANKQSFGAGVASSTSALGSTRRVGNLGNPDSSSPFDSLGTERGSIKEECAEIAPKLGVINQLLNELESRIEPVLTGPYPFETGRDPRGGSDMQRYLNGINSDLDTMCSRIRVLIDRVTL